jgi:hypothetical protein
MVQMFGWLSAEAACASRWNRARAWVSLATSSGRKHGLAKGFSLGVQQIDNLVYSSSLPLESLRRFQWVLGADFAHLITLTETDVLIGQLFIFFTHVFSPVQIGAAALRRRSRYRGPDLNLVFGQSLSTITKY